MSKTIHIVSVSGGKDSTALYLLCKEFLGNDFIPIFADTGHEHPVTVNYVKNLHHLVGDGAPEVKIVKADFTKRLEKKGKKATGSPMLDLVVWKGRAPSTKAQFCTEHLKLWPIFFWLHEKYPKKKYRLEMFTGIRKGESARRSQIQNPFSWNGFYDCESVMPMLYESDETMFDLMKQYNIPPNPLYGLGYERVGCFPCIHSRKHELELLPDWAWDRLKEYEEATGRIWFAPNILPKHLRINGLCPIDRVRDWSKTTDRKMKASQMNLLKSKPPEDAPSCMTGFVICE